VDEAMVHPCFIHNYGFGMDGALVDVVGLWKII